MPGPWIRFVPAGHGLYRLTEDQLVDRLCRMGEAPRIYPPSEIRATYAEAERRGLVTRSEAEAGIAICIKIKPLKANNHNGAHY
jgi:hypothetical protein